MNEEQYRLAMENIWGLSSPVFDRMSRLALCFGLASKLAPQPEIVLDNFVDGRLEGVARWSGVDRRIKEHKFEDMEDLRSILSLWHNIQEAAGG